MVGMGKVEVITGVKVTVGGTSVGVLVKVGGEVTVGSGVGVMVDVGGGMKGVLLGDGVGVMVGVDVMVGVPVIVLVVVGVGVTLAVSNPVGVSMVKVTVGVFDAKITGVQDGVRVGLSKPCPPRPGAKSAATAPKK
jgi:hypothetical protein